MTGEDIDRMVDRLLFGGVDAARSARTSPRVIDLVAALATGSVGAFALVRSDALGTASAVGDHRVELAATPIAVAWAESQGWRVVSIEVDEGALRVLALGPPPELEPEDLRAQLDAAGIELDLVVDLVVGGTRTVPAG